MGDTLCWDPSSDCVLLQEHVQLSVVKIELGNILNDCNTTIYVYQQANSLFSRLIPLNQIPNSLQCTQLFDHLNLTNSSTHLPIIFVNSYLLIVTSSALPRQLLVILHHHILTLQALRTKPLVIHRCASTPRCSHQPEEFDFLQMRKGLFLPCNWIRNYSRIDSTD